MLLLNKNDYKKGKRMKQKRLEYLDSLRGLAFYTNRIFRIYPAYIIALGVCVLLGYMNFHEMVKHMLLLNGRGHFWTIPVEMKFYIFVPILLYLLSRLSKKYKISVLAMLIIIISVLMPYTNYPENTIEVIWYIPVFLTGMLTGIIFNMISDKKIRYMIC